MGAGAGVSCAGASSAGAGVSSAGAGAGSSSAGAGTSSAGAGMSSVISSFLSENIESETERVSDFVRWTRLLGILLTEWCST